MTGNNVQVDGDLLKVKARDWPTYLVGSNYEGVFGELVYRQPEHFGKEKTMSNAHIWYSDDERDYNYPAKAPAKVTYKGSTYSLVHESQLRLMPWIRKVIFNPPATIVFWTDGTKTVVKVKENGKKGKRDKFSEEYGLAMAIAKKFFGSRSAFTKNVENASRPGKGRK